MKKLELGISSVLAGILISVSGAVYLGSGKAPIGAILFAVGLFTICTRGMALYTGRVGYWIRREDKRSYFLELLMIWLGNLVGCILTGLAVGIAKPNYCQVAQQMAQAKLEQNLLQTWILALFCGLLMYIAVDHFRSNPDCISRFFGIFLCVPAFILAGLEHVVADMFFFALGVPLEQWGTTLLFLFVCSLGNACGAWLIPCWDTIKQA